MKLYLSDGCRLRARVSGRGFAREWSRVRVWGASCSGCDAGVGRASRFVDGVSAILLAV